MAPICVFITLLLLAGSLLASSSVMPWLPDVDDVDTLADEVLQSQPLVSIKIMLKHTKRCFSVSDDLSNLDSQPSLTSVMSIAEDVCKTMRDLLPGTPPPPKSCPWTLIVDDEESPEDCFRSVSYFMSDRFSQFNSWQRGKGEETRVVLQVGLNDLPQYLFVASSSDDSLLQSRADFFAARLVSLYDFDPSSVLVLSASVIAEVQSLLSQRLIMAQNVVESTVLPLLSLTPTAASSTCPFTEAVPAGAAAPPAAVFWHVALFDEGEESAGIGIAREQYEAIMNAGVADAVDRINIFVAGPNEKLLAGYRRGMLDPKFVVHPKNASLTDFEFSTLSRLQDYCRETPSAFVLYLHTKGSSRPSSDQTFVRGHRKYMEHFVLSRSRSCLASLRNGASACGVQLTTRSSSFDTFPGAARFYAGNFWWARCEHVNLLPDVWKVRTWGDRRLAEAWIGFAGKACMMNCVILYDKNFHTELTFRQEYESDKGCDEQLNVIY